MAKDANWIQIDPTSLGAEHAAAYEAYKVEYRLAKAARERFELGMQREASLPVGQRMVFGYNFGKLSIAIVADDRPERKPKQAVMSLVDYLAAQAAR